MHLSTPHAHTTYVDGKSTAREMVEAALAKGFFSLGLSEHAEDGVLGLDFPSEQAYRQEARALQAEYAGRLRLWVGMEADSIVVFDRAPYDYAIGSVHYVPDGESLCAVDGDPDIILQCIRRSYGGDPLAYLSAYYERLSAFVCSYHPDIIGHFDLPRKWNEKLHLFSSADPRYRRIALSALERMAESGALLEVNTGAIARGTMDDVYPEAYMLSFWRKMGGRAIIGTDCHLAEKLDTGVERAVARLREAGYDRVALLGNQDTLFIEESL